MASFGQRFKQLRTTRNQNQEDMIKDFNAKYNYSFTKSAVSQYENDKRIPEIDALIAFAEYFGVSIDYLLGREEPLGNFAYKELKEIGIPYLQLAKEAQDKGIKPETIKTIIDALEKEKHGSK